MDATINGLRLYYTDQGNPAGIPFVFLHGFPFSHDMWSPQIDIVKDRYRLITYDHRGHGRSEVGDGQFTLELLVDDFIALLDHLRIPKAIVCGLSMGGYIALRAIERHPDRFRALVLCDTRSESDTNEAKLKRTAGVRTVKKEGVAAFGEGFLKAVFAPESFERKAEAVDKIRKIIQNNPPLGVAGTLIALATRTDTTAYLPKIQVPTLILVGEKDGVTPPSAAQAMQQQIPQAKMFVIPNAGHMSNLENPEAFNQHLLDFLKILPAA